MSLQESSLLQRILAYVNKYKEQQRLIMSNIAEGFERGGRRTEFHQFLVIAKGFCAEVRLLLYVERDVGYIISEDFVKVNELALEVGRIIGGMRASIQKQKETIK